MLPTAGLGMWSQGQKAGAGGRESYKIYLSKMINSPGSSNGKVVSSGSLDFW